MAQEGSEIEDFIRIVPLTSYGLVAGLRPVYGTLYEVSIRRGSINGELVRTAVLHADSGKKSMRDRFNAYLHKMYPYQMK
jgi:hypothetical protein